MSLKRKFNKPLFWLAVLAGLIVLFFLFRAFVGKSKESVDIKGRLDIDLGVFQIVDKQDQKVLRAKSLPIRKESYRLPSMRLPLLVLGKMTKEQIRPCLETLAEGYADVNLTNAEIKDFTGILTSQAGSKIFWIDKSSGAFNYFDKTVIDPSPFPRLDPCLLVKRALVLARKKLSLTWPPKPPEPDPESLDILHISQVMAAEIKDGETKPRSQCPSEYFVAFGRRYRGIPVVGSRLIARLGPNGELMGVQETWRPIIGEQGSFNLDASSFTERLTAGLSQEKVLKPDQSVEKDIKILGTVWGYMEAPVGRAQEMLVPGVLVNFRLKSQGVADQVSQIVIPMVDADFPILGALADNKPGEASTEKTKIE